jgi:hypothetical protein
MRTIKRLLFFVGKIAVLLVGFIFSLLLAEALGFALGSETHGISTVGFFAGFICGLSLTAIALLQLRRKTCRERSEHDLVGWKRSQAQRKLHPTRTKYKRVAARILIWAPSAIAALVLFFFPVASHLLHPSSRYLAHYYVRIPWTYAVIPSEGWRTNLAHILIPSRRAEYNWFLVVVNSSGRGRFGMTPFLVWPFWNTLQPISEITFESDPNAAVLGSETVKARSESATQVREFRLGGVELTCWQYRWTYRSEFWPSSGFVWKVDCATPPEAGPQNFQARFYGSDEDLAAFYRIIEGVTQVP